MDEAKSADDIARSKRKPNWGCLIAAVGLLFFAYIVFRTLSPSDWVEVKISNIPAGIEQVMLIAKDSEGVEALDWYESKLIPFTIPARDGGWGKFDGEFNYSIQWKRASSYGVLAKHHDDRWLLWWLEPDEVKRPSLRRYVVGGGIAEIALPGDARTEEPSRQVLGILGAIEGEGD